MFRDSRAARLSPSLEVASSQFTKGAPDEDTRGDRRWAADRPAAWAAESSVIVLEDDWPVRLRADVLAEHQNDPADAGTRRRLVLEHPGSAVALAINDEGSVLCVKQYRHAVKRICVELPAGLREATDVSTLQTAQRELWEETGYTSDKWRLLNSSYPAAGLSSERVDIFLAEDPVFVGREEATLSLEESRLEFCWIGLDALRRAVRDGNLMNAQIIIAVHLLTELRAGRLT